MPRFNSSPHLNVAMIETGCDSNSPLKYEDQPAELNCVCHIAHAAGQLRGGFRCRGTSYLSFITV